MPHLSRLVKEKRNHADFQFSPVRTGRPLNLPQTLIIRCPERTPLRGFSYNYLSACPRYQIKSQINPLHKLPTPVAAPLPKRAAPVPHTPFGRSSRFLIQRNFPLIEPFAMPWESSFP